MEALLVIFAVGLYIGGALGAATVLVLDFVEGRVKLLAVEDLSAMCFIVVLWPVLVVFLAFVILCAGLGRGE